MLQNVQLWYLIQIEHYQSLSLAAEKLHVSQPAISAAIKRLETQLGVKLTERSYKGLTLTSEGKQVVELAKKAFVHLDEIETMFQRPQTEENRFLLDDVIIYTNPIFSPLLLSLLSKEYTKQTATHALQIFNITPDAKESNIIAHSTNTIIFAILPESFLLPSGIGITILAKSKAYIMCTKDFPYIPPEQTSISIKELVHVPLIISKQQFAFQNNLLSTLSQYGEPNIKVVAPDSNSISATLKTGSVATCTNKLINSLNDPDMRYLAIRNSPTFHLCLLYNKNINPEIPSYLKELMQPLLI